MDLIETSVQTLPGLDVRHETALRTARGLLGSEAFDQAWSRGRPLDEDSAIAVSLQEAPGRPAPLSIPTTSRDV